MRVISLQSGSNGNCIYVEAGGVRLLFDAGISGIQVPLFNAGQTETCKAVYEVTAEALVGMPSVKPASKETLTGALAAIKEQTSAREQAWILRRALDAVYEGVERAD